jgi:hypothetical protein
MRAVSGRTALTLRETFAALAALCAPACGDRESSLDPPITLVFVGDVTFDETVTRELAEHGLGPSAALKPTRAAVEASDLAAFNLKSAVSDDAAPIAKT